MTKAKRLTNYFLPDKYNVNWHIADDYKSFSGSTTVTGTVQKSGYEIYFHLNGPKIESTTVNGVAIKTSYNKDTQELLLKLSGNVNKGDKLKIEFKFVSELTPTMEGIYPSFYEENGQKKVIISTQFESTHAREAFPCIDEPAAKATFDVALNTPNVTTVLGNTPVKLQSKHGDRIETTFETSPKMSPYLLAIAFGDLAKMSTKTSRGTDVNVYSVNESVNRLAFSLDVAKRSLEFYENYFGIDYPLAKLDMVAVPEFAVGAMENWGLVTYRETAMLFDEEHSSVPTKRRVIEVITHELAHQWFGNLVTMRWWDDLWLNESFATFMSYLCSRDLFPHLGYDELFMQEEYFPALHADSNSKTTSIYAPLEDPRDINEHFDPAITYGKGSVVLRMLHNYIGDDDFKKGLHNYLTEKQYDNAVGGDLWNAMKEASGKPVDTFMRAWVNQPGYPLLNVDEKSILQKRFFSSPKEQKNYKTKITWPIAIDDFSFDSESAKFDFANAKLNKDQSGVFRVNYPENAWHKLAKQFSTNEFTDVDRMGLLDDVFALAGAGVVPTTTALEMVHEVEFLTNDAVWDMAAVGLSSVTSVFADGELRPKIDKFAQNLINKQYTRVGWESNEGESPFDVLLRSTIIAMAGKFRLEDAVETAKQRFHDYTENKQSIDPNLRGIIYGVVARDGDNKLFDLLHSMHNKESLAEEKRRLAGALCSFTDSRSINRAISLIKSEDVRQQEVISWIFALYRNRHSRDAIWDWQKQNWDWITEKFGGGHLYSYFVMGVAAFNENSKADEVEEFFKDKSTVGFKRTLEQSVEQIRTKADWRTRDYDSVSKFLS